MTLAKTAVGSLLLCVMLVGCGADVVAEVEPPVLPPDAAPEVNECAPPLIVPEGPVWVGGMRWSDEQLVSIGCGESGGMVTLRFLTPNFFLDQDEATNACYAHCVDAGTCEPPLPVPPEPNEDPVPAWNNPTMRRVPTLSLGETRAETFCRWRGGRLPSLAELMRAEHGDALAIMNAALMDLWLSCSNEKESAECDGIWERLNGWPSDVRSWNLDQGPFGHFDIAGSVIELTNTRLPGTVEELDALCGIASDSRDPQSFGSGERIGVATAGNLLTPPMEGNTVVPFVAGLSGAGVRCAYDPL